MRFDEQFASYARQTNDGLRDCLRYPGVRLQAAVVDAMRYSLLDAGKRLRAALVLEFARLASAPREGATALACAIEMLHAYSLIFGVESHPVIRNLVSRRRCLPATHC